ncbi:MAG: response regulator [Alphaproteobacteria bacterium]|nr:response regulator [Alphaproteobacteria bacterium]
MFGNVNTATAHRIRTDEEIASMLLRRANPGDQPVDILLVEDAHSDVVFTRTALDMTGMPYALHILRSGEEVIPYLNQRRLGRLPDVILLDMGMQRMGGFDVLEELAKSRTAFRAIPVIIISGHENFEYARKIDNLYVPAYITKPCASTRMREVLSRIRHAAMPAPILAQVH